MDIFSYIVNQPDSTWTTLGAYLGGSALVATILQVIKHSFKIQDAKKLVTLLLGSLSLLVSLADLALSSGNNDQFAKTLGQHGAFIMAGAVIVHRFAVSPAYHYLTGTLGSLVADANNYRAITAPQSVMNPNTPQAQDSTFQG